MYICKIYLGVLGSNGSGFLISRIQNLTITFQVKQTHLKKQTFTAKNFNVYLSAVQTGLVGS
jgi:hypothetical protein